MDALAAHAGVSKATIYRWWPDKEALALDALYDQWADRGDAPPDRGSLRERPAGPAAAVGPGWFRSRPYAPVIGAFITKAHTDPAFAGEYVTRLVRPRRDRARIAVRPGRRPRRARTGRTGRDRSRPALRRAVPPAAAPPRPPHRPVRHPGRRPHPPRPPRPGQPAGQPPNAQTPNPTHRTAATKDRTHHE